MKDIVCPGCKKSVTVNGFYHDTNLTMKCSNCNGIVFPTVKADEDRCRTTLQGNNNAVYWAKRDLLPIKIGPASPPPKVNTSDNWYG